MTEPPTIPDIEDSQVGPRLNEMVENLEFLVRGGLSLEAAAKRLGMMISHPELIKSALTEYRRRAGLIRSLKEPGAIVDVGLQSWYLGSRDGDRFWPALEKHLQSKGRDTKSLDDASTKIVSLLAEPNASRITTRGLVVGYVQSGKTENFTAVISKAADAGYRFFIVLSGMNNALRRQTQERLDRDVIGLNPEEWYQLTDATYDFRAEKNVNSLLTEKQSSRILGVLKKNKVRLVRLLHWLKSARPEVIRNCPVLIVDDEADQASPNSAKGLLERTEINRALVDILKTLPKAAYVGYTATPFANLLINPNSPEDFYPRDFIVDLPMPKNYFGPERIFGRDQFDWDDPDAAADGLDMVRTVPADDLPRLRPPGRDAREDFSPEMTNSLRDALRYFVLTAAARRARRQGDYHCSMLVHGSEYTVVHDRFRAPIEQELSNLRAAVERADAAVLAGLRDLWSREQAAVPPALVGCIPVTYEDMAQHLADVLGEAQVKIEHGKSADRIVYPEYLLGTPGKIYIVVGGNVLSRGLTIEGLTVSFFVRSASAYDTLLQMGRWFGYRPGYEDLPRLWMTDELRSYFYHLATVEREIRFDINRYKNTHVTPLEFGVRIRTHPFLAITSSLKMQNAVTAQMTFRNQAVQTLVFRHKDKGWLLQNIAATKRLIAAIQARDIAPTKLGNRPNLVFENVPSDDVMQFLTDYQIHESHEEMKTKLLRDYIGKENENGRLLAWNVGIVTKRDDSEGTIDLGLEQRVPLINRARHKRNMNFADIKALMSERDVGVDVDSKDAETRTLQRKKLQELRNTLLPDRGLLLIYPIHRNSHPLSARSGVGDGSGVRMPLEADEDVIGIALVFPDTEGATSLEYVTVDLSSVERDDIEEVEDTDP